MAAPSYKVVVVADSRACDIGQWLDDWGDIELDVVPAPSTGIEAAIEILITLRRDATPDLVLILNGICDVLVKSKTTHKYFIMKETTDELVSYYKDQLKRGRELLEIFYDDSKWMFNPLTGADIADYNNPQRRHMSAEELVVYHRIKTPDDFQNVLNEAVVKINGEIGKLNKLNHTITPYTASFVHRHYSGSYHHSYQYTSDGCHLSQEGKVYWAKQIKKAITKTRSMARDG